MKRLSLTLTTMLLSLMLLGCPTPPPPEGGSPSPPVQSPPTQVTTPEAPPPPAEIPYESMEVKNGGTLTGKVTVANKDTIGPIKPAQVTKDQEACGQEIPSEVLQLKGTALKNALVYLEDIEKGKAASAASLEVAMEKCRFVPHVLWAPRGSTLTLKNADPHAHAPHIYVHDNTNDTIEKATLDPGATKQIALDRTGLLRLNSDTHTWMQAWVYVSPHPYVALTDEDGKYKIADVPPGKYTMIVWHEGWEGQDQFIPVEVKAGGTVTENVEFDGEVFQVLEPSGAEKPTAPPQKPPGPGMSPGGPSPGTTPADQEVDEGGPDDGGEVEQDASPAADETPAGEASPGG